MGLDVSWFVDRRLVHEFHTSERKSFRGCRRRWDWIFRQSYYPKMTEKPLDFGTAFHLAMEVFYDPETYGVLPPFVRMEKAIGAFVEKTNKQRRHYLEVKDANTLDDEVEKDFDERVELGIGMLRYFVDHVVPQPDMTDWRPLKVEVEFMTPIPHPYTQQSMWCRCRSCWEKWIAYDTKEGPGLLSLSEAAWDVWQGLPVVYAGRIDCIGEDENGNVWIIDWKTTARIASDHSFLDLDDQVGSYPWALWKIGMPVRGFIYHEQYKGYPLPPPRNKNIRLGRMYSVKADMDTSAVIYRNTVKEGDKEAYEKGLYDDYIDLLEREGKTYYQRHKIYQTEERLLEVEHDLGLEVLDMLSEDLRIYPNPGRFSCERCAFQTPCTEQSNGNQDGMFYALEEMFEKRPAYYLREELSTDRKSQQ